MIAYLRTIFTCAGRKVSFDVREKTQSRIGRGSLETAAQDQQAWMVVFFTAAFRHAWTVESRWQVRAEGENGRFVFERAGNIDRHCSAALLKTLVIRSWKPKPGGLHDCLAARYER